MSKNASLERKASLFGPSAELNNLLLDLKEHFDRSVIGAALYLVDDYQTAAVIGSVQTPWDNEGIVINKLAHKKLMSKDSVGAQAALTGRGGIKKSAMVDDHFCVNTTLPDDRACIQLVTRERVSERDWQTLSASQGLSSRISKVINDLKKQFGPRASDIVPTRENYPSHLVMEFDITGYTRLYNLRGSQHALRTRAALKQVLENTLIPLSGSSLAVLDRDGGDSFWLKMDLTSNYPSREKFETDFPSFLNDTIIPAILTTLQVYNRRVKGLGAEGKTPLKASLALSDLNETNNEFELPRQCYEGEALFALDTYLQRASRESSIIVFGQDIAGHIDSSQYKLSVRESDKKERFFTDQVASLKPIT